MKNPVLKLTFILSLFACGSAIALASNSGDPYFKKGRYAPSKSVQINSETDLYEVIRELVPCPAFFNPTDSDGLVYFNLYFGEDASLSIHNIRSNDVSLSAYVKSCLENVKVIAGIDQRGKTIRMALQFKLI